MSKRARKEKTVTFKLVHPSYEDVEYDETPSVMVPAEEVEKHQRKAGEDEPVSVAALLGFGASEEDYTARRNMLEMDNKEEVDVELFKGAVECEFGEDFIQQMMYGDPKAVVKKSKPPKGEEGEHDEEEEGEYEDDDEEDWDDDDEYYGEDGEEGDDDEEEDDDGVEYPKHDVTSRAIDRQFTRMMQEFDMDAELNDPDVTDPRACGPLGVDQYLLALEEFVEENAGVDHAWEQPAKNRGLINQLKYMVHSAGAFDTDEGGVYMTTQLPEKQARLMEEYRKRVENIRAEARKRVLEEQKRKAAASGAATGGTTEPSSHHQDPNQEDEEEEEEEKEEEVYRVVEVAPKERYDCETIVSTYSTIYNHPNVIAASSKRVDISARAQRRKAKELAAQRSKAARQEREAAAAAEEDAREERREMLEMLSVRPKDESTEEKQARRKAVKQAQREKRQQKKQVKEVYHSMSNVQAENAKKSRSMKAQLPLSLVRGEGV